MVQGLMRVLAFSASITGLSLAGCGTEEGVMMTHPTVVLATNLGEIRIELFPEDSPISTANFLSYVDDGFYDGIIFHRVIPEFMIQSGGHEIDLAQREATFDAIQNESDNGLVNLRGTIAMARTQPPHSARAQFFINLSDNAMLDYGARPGGWGYAVFGRVIEGMDVVDVIASRPTGRVGGYDDVPNAPVLIRSARRGADVGVEAPAGESGD